MAAEIANWDKTASVGPRLEEITSGRLLAAGLRVTSDLRGSGYHDIQPVLSARQYPADEHIVMGTSFHCCMLRHRLFAHPNESTTNHGIEWFLKMHESGYRNFYLGTLKAGVHKPAADMFWLDDYALASLWAQHGSSLEHWRIKHLGYNCHVNWSKVKPGDNNWFELPHRYRVADRVNEILKHNLGPLHQLAKRFTLQKNRS